MLTRLGALALGVALVGGGLTAAHAADAPVGTALAPPVTWDGLPVGAPTTLPWWQHRRLHLGDRVIRTRRSDIVSRSGTTVVATDADRRMGRPATWYLVHGKKLLRLPMQTRTAKPRVAANGRWLAWLEVRAKSTHAYRRIERYRVVIYNVERQRIAASFRDRRRVAWEDGINGIWLRTLSNQGRLVLTQGSDGMKALSPGGRLASFHGARVGSGIDLDGWPRGTTIHRAKTDANLYGVVGRDGAFDRVGRFTAPYAGVWSAHGNRYAYSDDGPTGTSTFWVRSLDGERVQLQTPEDVPFLGIVGWESADAVILWHFDDYSNEPVSNLVRCSATTGACEKVPHGPKAGAHATMPSRF